MLKEIEMKENIYTKTPCTDIFGIPHCNRCVNVPYHSVSVHVMQSCVCIDKKIPSSNGGLNHPPAT